MSTITTKDGKQIYYKDWGKRAAEWSLRVTIAAAFLLPWQTDSDYGGHRVQ